VVICAVNERFTNSQPKWYVLSLVIDAEVSLIDNAFQLLRIRSPAGTARINVEASTPGEEFSQIMLATIPASDPRPDLSTLKLSNQPGSSSEAVPFEALKGRKVGDMGFR
jgi:hypothetical protein